jgi:subtilisin-like proprotein convertase family protein
LGQKAAYSNWGNEIFIAAPSSNGIPAISLNQTGMIPTAPPIQGNLEGLAVFSTDRVGTAGYDAGDFTDSFGGTSSAAPVVAGVVGLMLSVNPSLTLAQVKDILRQTAEKVVDPNPDPQLGLRLGSYERNGHSPWFGYGKINAYAAVQESLRRKPALPAPDAPVYLSWDPPQPVPIQDNSRLVQSLMVKNAGLVVSVEVGVTLEHEFLGDVSLSLICPSGEQMLLQPRTLGRQTRLDTLYTIQTSPALGRCLQTKAQGNWQLVVTDAAVGCTGALHHWHLSLTLSY